MGFVVRVPFLDDETVLSLELDFSLDTACPCSQRAYWIADDGWADLALQSHERWTFVLWRALHIHGELSESFVEL